MRRPYCSTSPRYGSRDCQLIATHYYIGKMASQKGTEERDIPPEEQVEEELEGENGSEKPTSEVVTKDESGKKSKKKRTKKKQEQETVASVSGAEATAMRSMRELLTQLGVSEQTDGDKSHVFWDTQPVPKLGEWPGATHCIQRDKRRDQCFRSLLR